MTLDEAVEKVEGWFHVVDQAHFPQHYMQNGKIIGAAGVDASRAVIGEKYVTLTSSGLVEPGHEPSVFFTSAEFAARWWLYSVEDYAESIADRDEWPNLHLYWRQKPLFEQRAYVLENQADLLRTAPEHSELMRANLGVVYSRLVISKQPPT